MPFGDHLEDLRRRLIYAAWGVLPIMCIALYYGKDLLAHILHPITRALLDANLPPNLQATGPLESFMTYFKISLTVTFIVAAPWVLLQLWLFIAPGLYANERRFAYLLAPLSVTLTALGVSFCYMVMFPITLAFLIDFGASVAPEIIDTAPLPAGVVIPTLPALTADPTEPPLHGYWYNSTLKQLRICVGKPEGGTPLVLGANIVAGGAILQQYRISEYVSLLLGLCIAFAVSFQMPVAVLILGWANIVSVAFLSKYRRHALFVCTVLGAVLTPTVDFFTMFLLAGPLYALYEVGILLLRIFPASRVAKGFDTSPRTHAAEQNGDADAE